MNRGRVGEEKGGKETDGCPLTECYSFFAILEMHNEVNFFDYSIKILCSINYIPFLLLPLLSVYI
jgi:hypothetical protein